MASPDSFIHGFEMDLRESTEVRYRGKFVLALKPGDRTTPVARLALRQPIESHDEAYSNSPPSNHNLGPTMRR